MSLTYLSLNCATRIKSVKNKLIDSIRIDTIRYLIRYDSSDFIYICWWYEVVCTL